tara:strand:- start:2578 stop:2763 length:186 start_codon:yes stop_codon:yes gene_type:complete
LTVDNDEKIKVFDDLDKEILEDYVKDIYQDFKQLYEEIENAEIIEEFETLKKEELDGDSFS